MNKELIFDMDGTIADLYAVEDWLPRLREEDPTPYLEAKPIYDTFVLNTLLDILKRLGYKIKIVSWGSVGASKAYGREIRKAKLEWLKKYDFPADEIHIVKYGTPKAYYMDRSGLSILIDDNLEVRNDFQKAKMKNENQKSKMKFVFDAGNENLLGYLIDLIKKEV